ncbi:MAG TPA: helix-turn-helix domain-containing protein, partial [Gemmataceae bacterium]|nr:helix-turn-helix domain-containing protein [Gemmataceae bacterium]
TPEKVAVLRERARRRVPLWHPHDAGQARGEQPVASPEGNQDTPNGARPVPTPQDASPLGHALLPLSPLEVEVVLAIRRAGGNACHGTPAPPPPPGHAKALLTVKEAASYLAIGTRSVWKLLAAGKLQPVRLAGRTVRIPRRELERLAAGAAR